MVFQREKRPLEEENVVDAPEPKRRGRPPSKKKHRPEPLKGLPPGGRFLPVHEPLIQSVVTRTDLSLADMAVMLRCTKQTVANHKQRIAEGRPIKLGVHKPTVSALSEQETMTAEIRKIMADLPDSTATDVARVLFERTEIVRSTETIRRKLKALGFTLRKKPLTTAKYDAPTRLAFAKKWLAWMKENQTEDGEDNFVFIFTDESWMGAASYKKAQWADDNTELIPLEKERWAPKVHSWGGLWDGGAYILDFPLKGTGKRGGVTAKDFLAFVQAPLKECIKEAKKLHPGKQIIVMQDGAGTHNGAKQWLTAQKIPQIDDWPAHSPDLNPIENAWSWIKREIGKVVILHDNNAENRQKISETRDQVVSQMEGSLCSSYALSFKRRLEQVVELQGGFILY